MAATKKELEAQVLRMLSLPPDVSVEKSSIHYDHDVITLRLPVPERRICVLCGSDGCIVRGSGSWQELRHFPSGQRGTVLRIFKRRFFCPSCKASFFETPDWAIPRLRMTRPLFDQIFSSFTRMDSFPCIAKRLCIGESAVRSVFDSIEILHPEALPKTLCIDEFHADTGFWLKRRKKWERNSFNVNITDWKKHIVVDVLEQKSLTFLSKHFRRHYDKYQRDEVRFFVCDMSGSFLSLARDCFPKAVICIDDFHLIRRLEQVVTDVRIRLQNKAKEDGCQEAYSLLKHIQYPLLTKDSNWDRKWGCRKEEVLQRLGNAFSAAPELYEAYKALHHFHDILDDDSFAVQRDGLQEWLGIYLETPVPELRTAARTFYVYRAYILNAWRYSRSNGPCEGLNKKIKDVKRSMFGAHSFENFRKRVLLSCGDVKFGDPQLVLHLDQKQRK